MHGEVGSSFERADESSTDLSDCLGLLNAPECLRINYLIIVCHVRKIPVCGGGEVVLAS